MEKKYLVINCGSSSLKFSLYDQKQKNEIVNGYIEKIGKDDSFYTLKFDGKKERKERKVLSHSDAVEVMLEELLANNFIESINEIGGIGHRILHGGEKYSDSVLIDENVLNDIKSLTKLGPLHHPGEILGVESMMKALPKVPQVAVFDTAFHQTMPKENYLYAVPYSWYEENSVRKYGFHGTSHKYITKYMQSYLGKDDINLIICHLGSGASISCIKEGKCFDTSMGLTPLDGLIMGTRSGNIDPSIIEYISKERNLTLEEVNHKLNNESGLKGICGKNDNRDIEKLYYEGNELGILAMNMFKNSVVKFIAKYYFELNADVDAIVFTAGIGENAMLLRELIVESISKPMGIELDKNSNSSIAAFKEINTGKITTDSSKIPVWVVPTDEELMILEDTNKICSEEANKTKLKKIN